MNCKIKQAYIKHVPLTLKLNNMLKFAIGIPTLNRMDLLETAVSKYLHDFTCDIYIVDNGNQPHNIDLTTARIKYTVENKNLGVAGSWNVLCKQIFAAGNDVAVIVNDDIIMGFGDDIINQVCNKYPGRLISTILDWCIFIIPQSIFNKIGEFDSNFFPAYYEDKDYERRLMLANAGMVKSSLLAPLVYRSNMSAQKDSSILVSAHYNKLFYIKKWGGMPGSEKFSCPFDEKSRK